MDQSLGPMRKTPKSPHDALDSSRISAINPTDALSRARAKLLYARGELWHLISSVVVSLKPICGIPSETR